jgi:hypothetical protein
MCFMCDGESFAEVAFGWLDEIDTTGWALAGVEASDGVVPWAYTHGLVPSFDHPEFVVVGMGAADTTLLLNALAHAVAGGERFAEHETAELGDHVFTFGWVHPRQFEHGAFAIWTTVVEPVFDPRPERHALQVFPPECLVARGGRPDRWALSRPRRVLGRRLHSA